MRLGFRVTGWQKRPMKSLMGGSRIASWLLACRINAAFRRLKERRVYRALKNLIVRPLLVKELLLLNLLVCSVAVGQSKMENFSVTLKGDAEVPPNSSAAAGGGVAVYDP